MRLLLPMAYTIAFVMESATYADGKPSNPDKNFTYRLLEVDVEQDSQAHTRPATNDYADNSYQQSIIPRRTHPAYAAAAGSNGKQDDDQDRDDVKAARITTTKSKTSHDRRPTRTGNQWSSAKTEIPDDFQREISQLRIPRRVNKKKKSKSSSKKRRQQKTNADSDSYLGADMNLEDIDMDVNVDMDLDVGEEIKLGTDDVDPDKDGDSGNDDGENKNKNTGQKYSKGRKRRRRKKPKTKAKAKENRNRDSSASSSNAAADEEDDNNSNSANGEGGGNGDDDDENNHQEEEEEVEEKKEKVHKVTIKKKRPYVNSTKSTSGDTGGDTGSATKQNGTPIRHSHSHDFSKFPYQNVIGITPNRNNKGNTKSNAQTVGSGTGSSGVSNMVSANAAAAAALKALQKQKNNGGTRQPHQTTKPVRPLISQENAAAMALNPNHQENAGGIADNSAIRKGIKPRDVNLILRTKNSPRILIRRYKPLFGAYPVGVGLNLLGQRKLLGVGVYHRPRKTRKKACKKCKKRRGKHKFYGNTYPALASDVETIHAPTTCAPHTNGQHFSNGAFGNGFSASPSPLQSTSAFGGGAVNPWYAISGGQSSPFGGGDDDGGSSNPFSPYRYSPNRFEYVDENVISPRLPSQPVNTYLRMPLASFGGGGANGGGVVEGSARSNNNGNSNDDDTKGADVYETLPLLYSTEPPVQIDSSNQALAVATRKEPEQEEENQGGDEGQTAAEEDDQQQQQRRRRKKPQRGKKTAAESSPVYEVHETEYEPVTGHENVEDLAAVHQVETDASLFLDEQGDHPHNSRRTQDVENDASAADQHNQQIAAAEPEEKEDEEFQDYDYFDNNDAQQEPAKEQRDDDAEEDQADDQEDQQQQQEYVDDGDSNSEGNGDTDSDVENEIENENAQSAKLFDIPNADQWSYEMSESESK